MVSHDRPVYQEKHAAQLIMARRADLQSKAEYICADPVDRHFAFPLQSGGGPYILGNQDAKIMLRKGSVVQRLRFQPQSSGRSYLSQIDFGASRPPASGIASDCPAVLSSEA
jgi:hypothetical protein